MNSRRIFFFLRKCEPRCYYPSRHCVQLFVCAACGAYVLVFPHVCYVSATVVQPNQGRMVTTQNRPHLSAPYHIQEEVCRA